MSSRHVAVIGILIIMGGILFCFGTSKEGYYAEIYVLDKFDEETYTAYDTKYRFPSVGLLPEKDEGSLEEFMHTVSYAGGGKWHSTSASWHSVTLYPNAVVSGIICFIGLVTVAISFFIPSIEEKGPEFMQKEGSPIFCPSCGAENPPRSKFCIKCGIQLEQKQITKLRTKREEVFAE